MEQHYRQIRHQCAFSKGLTRSEQRFFVCDISRRVGNLQIYYSEITCENERRAMHKIEIISDFGEFLIAISITAQQDPKKKLEWAFSMYGTCHESHLTDTGILLFIRYRSQWIHREERNEENHGCK